MSRERCKYCSGSGRTGACGRCIGRGTLSCRYCDGSGCGWCWHGRAECGWCGGDGKMDCTACSGSGWAQAPSTSTYRPSAPASRSRGTPGKVLSVVVVIAVVFTVLIALGSIVTDNSRSDRPWTVQQDSPAQSETQGEAKTDTPMDSPVQTQLSTFEHPIELFFGWNQDSSPNPVTHPRSSSGLQAAREFDG